MYAPSEPNPNVRSIGLAIVLSLVTCGIYNLYWQYKQIEALNDMLRDDKYGFWGWLVLSTITCGLYHVYHEYRMSEDLATLCDREGRNDAVLSLVLSLFGLSIVVDAIQQSHINEYYGDSRL